MADDGNRTDGSADDGTSSNRAAGTVPGSPARPGGDDAGLAKILPFPRDWFGPIDDLVPVFPEPASGPAVISAASFWDEDAGAVHQVVESLDRRWVGDGDDVSLTSLESDVEEPDRDGAAEPPERVRRRRVFAIAVGVLGLVLVCAAVALALLIGGFGHSHSHLPSSAKPAASHTTRLKSANPAASHTTRLKDVPTRVIQQTVTVVAPAKTLVSPHRHRVRKAAVGRSAVETTHSSSVPVAPAQSLRSSASVPSAAQPARSESAAGTGSAKPARSGSAAGTGCVQSPDSGCMP